MKSEDGNNTGIHALKVTNWRACHFNGPLPHLLL